MRLLIALLVNSVRGLWALIRWPIRRLRRPPEWVRIRLTGQLPYRQRPRPPLLRRLLSRGRPPEASDVPSLHAMRTHLDRIAREPRVRGVILIVHELAMSAAQRAAVREVLQSFRASGKQVVGWGVSLSVAELEVLAGADRILVPKAGRVELMGYAAELTAIGSGLQRLGVRAEFLRRGDYKTAPELFTRSDISEIQRATTEHLLDDRLGLLVDVISTGRKLPPERVRALIDEGPYSARRALSAGLIDGLCSEVELPEVLARPPGAAADARPAGPAQAASGASPRVVPSPAAPEPEGQKPEAPPKAKVGGLAAFQRSRAWAPTRYRPLKRQPGLAMVPLRGAIMPGSGGVTPMGRAVGSDGIVRALRRLEKLPGVDAVLLLIESPGGSALASELILEAVQRLNRERPVVAYVDGVCASGGYMAAMGARELWAAPLAIVGSIGVFGGKFDLSGLMHRLGIKREIITRGRNAALHSSARGFTPEERAALDLEIEETYRAFLDIVAEGRNTTPEAVHAHAEGRIFSGREALAHGLVDRNGSFEEAARRALQLAGQPEGPYRLLSVTPSARELAIRQLLPALRDTHLWALATPVPRFSDERRDAVVIDDAWIARLRLLLSGDAQDRPQDRW
ncbi:MAG TPA: signal peptide peptidase SppA [Myxococcaceae bacterium]|nr:signal peptide peptidase SppA [Myxococcaceae bacterium]